MQENTLQDHPLYDELKAQGLDDVAIKARIDQEEEMREFHEGEEESIRGTIAAEERMRNGE